MCNCDVIVEQTSKEEQKIIQIHNFFVSTKLNISQHERPEEKGSQTTRSFVCGGDRNDFLGHCRDRENLGK